MRKERRVEGVEVAGMGRRLRIVRSSNAEGSHLGQIIISAPLVATCVHPSDHHLGYFSPLTTLLQTYILVHRIHEHYYPINRLNVYPPQASPSTSVVSLFDGGYCRR